MPHFGRAVTPVNRPEYFVIANQHMNLSACAFRTFLHSQDEIEGLALFVTPAYDVPELNNDQIPANPTVTIVYRASKLKSTPCSTDICMNIAEDYGSLRSRLRLFLGTAQQQCGEQEEIGTGTKIEHATSMREILWQYCSSSTFL